VSGRYDDMSNRDLLLHTLEQAASACRFLLELEHRKGRKARTVVLIRALFVGLARMIEDLPEPTARGGMGARVDTRGPLS
jgi:hypothetical protein